MGLGIVHVLPHPNLFRSLLHPGSFFTPLLPSFLSSKSRTEVEAFLLPPYQSLQVAAFAVFFPFVVAFLNVVAFTSAVFVFLLLIFLLLTLFLISLLFIFFAFFAVVEAVFPNPAAPGVVVGHPACEVGLPSSICSSLPFSKHQKHRQPC